VTLAVVFHLSHELDSSDLLSKRTLTSNNGVASEEPGPFGMRRNGLNFE